MAKISTIDTQSKLLSFGPKKGFVSAYCKKTTYYTIIKTEIETKSQIIESH